MEYRFEIYESVPSTMDLVREQAHNGGDEGLCIQAFRQEAGRGRQGRTWVSEEGNLYISLLLRPQQKLADYGQMAFVGALAVKDALILAEVKPQIIRIKWPNDVLVEANKISGLLLEAGKDHNGEDFLILGLGLNIFHAPEERSKLADYAAGFRDTAPEHQNYMIKHFRDVVLDRLKYRYSQWHKEGFAPIRSEWLGYAARLGEAISVKLPQERFEGIFEGIDEQGTLLLQEKSGITRKIQSGDVFFSP